MIDKVQTEVRMVQRHLQVLRLVFEDEPIGIVAISSKTGYPNHKIRYSLRRLEEAGAIEPTKFGAVTTDNAHEFVRESRSALEPLEEIGVEQAAEF